MIGECIRIDGVVPGRGVGILVVAALRWGVGGWVVGSRIVEGFREGGGGGVGD